MGKRALFLLSIFLPLVAALYPFIALAEGPEMGVEDRIANFLAGLMVGLGGTIASIGILIFNLAAKYGVLHFAETFGSIAVINTIWGGLRDLANIALVFFFLFIGIATIVGNSKYGYRQLLFRLLLVAILINFSLFAVRAVIDASHLFVEAIYNGFQLTNADCGTSTNDCEVTYGLGGVYAEQLGIASFIKFPLSGLETVGSAPAKWLDILAFGFMAFLFLAIAGIVFVAAGGILIGRLIALVFAMILAPLAAAAYILPQTQSYYSKWLNMVLKNAFVAPVLFLLLGLSLLFARGVFSQDVMGRLSNSLFVYNSDTSIFAAIIGFIVVIGFLLMSLKLAQDWGVAGAKTSVGWARGVQKTATRFAQKGATATAGATIGTAAKVTAGTAARAGQYSVGLAGRTISRQLNKTSLIRSRTIGGAIARGVERAANYTGQSSYDPRAITGSKIASPIPGVTVDIGQKIQGFDKRAEAKQKKIEDEAKRVRLSDADQRKRDAAEEAVKQKQKELEGKKEEIKNAKERQEPAKAQAQQAATTKKTQAQQEHQAAVQVVDTELAKKLEEARERLETEGENTLRELREEETEMLRDIETYNKRLMQLRNAGDTPEKEGLFAAKAAREAELRQKQGEITTTQTNQQERLDRELSTLEKQAAQKKEALANALETRNADIDQETKATIDALDSQVKVLDEARQQIEKDIANNQATVDELEFKGQQALAAELQQRPGMFGTTRQARRDAAKSILRTYSKSGKERKERRENFQAVMEELDKEKNKPKNEPPPSQSNGSSTPRAT